MVKNFTKLTFPDAERVPLRHAIESLTIERAELGAAKCLKNERRKQFQGNFGATRDQSGSYAAVGGVGWRSAVARQVSGAKEELGLSSACQADRAQRKGDMAKSDDEPRWLVRAAEQLAQDSAIEARGGCRELPGHRMEEVDGLKKETGGHINWDMWSELPLDRRVFWLTAELQRTSATALRIIESQAVRLQQQEDTIALLADALCEAHPHVADEGARDRVSAGCRAACEAWGGTARAGAVAVQVPQCAARTEPQPEVPPPADSSATAEDMWVEAKSESDAELEESGGEEESAVHFATLIGRLEASYAARETRRAAQQKESEQKPTVSSSGAEDTEEQRIARREMEHEQAWRRDYARREAAAYKRYLYREAGERHRRRVEAAAARNRRRHADLEEWAQEDRAVGETGRGHDGGDAEGVT